MFLDWTKQTAKVTGLTGRVRCEIGWSLDDAWSRRLHDFDLWYVWAGSGVMTTNTEEIILRPGVCFWMRPGNKYLAEQDDTNRLGVTYIHFDVFDQQGEGLSKKTFEKLPPEWFEISDNLFFNTVTRKIIQLLQPDLNHSKADYFVERQTAELLLTSLLHDLDANLSKRNVYPNSQYGKKYQQIMDITMQITENLQNVPDISSFAAQLGYSDDHFSRIFKHAIGMGPQAFIIQARSNRAKHLLLETILPIKQIAERTGYQDVYFFSRQFKAKTGCSPTAFRSKMQDG